MIILKPGAPKAGNPYSRSASNIRNGPYKPKASLPANNALTRSLAKTALPATALKDGFSRDENSPSDASTASETTNTTDLGEGV